MTKVLSAVERLKQTRQQIKSNSGDRVDTTKIPHGSSEWRILPGWRTEPFHGLPTEEYHIFYACNWIKHPTKASEKNPAQKQVLAMLPSLQAAIGDECPIAGQIASAVMTASNPDVARVQSISG